MGEFMKIYPSHFGCIKSTILTGLRQTYIDSSCPGLGIGIKVSGLLVGPAVIDPNEGCCITRCTFLLTHITPWAGDKLKRPTKNLSMSFHLMTQKNMLRFKGEKGQDAIYEITLCKYLDPDNELPIDQSVRFLCVAHPVCGIMECYRIKSD